MARRRIATIVGHVEHTLNSYWFVRHGAHINDNNRRHAFRAFQRDIKSYEIWLQSIPIQRKRKRK